MTSNTVLRLGLIGTGQMAAHYAHSWVSMPEVAFVALSDVNAGSRRKFAGICRGAGRAEPREFDDFRSMLTTCRDELDAVYVCTPHALHAEHGIAVVESGLDLLIEKPMVTTVAEAERLWKTAFDHDPVQTGAGLNLAIVACETGNRAEALRTLDRLLVFAPDNGQARNLATEIRSGKMPCTPH